ncbi:hypothetical protein MTR67_038630 [Solanum verrucosum]|uniref:Uncharacterized protein n=1 Tax=Solanum verrucosum TaxID=315347 RepID=A0AAF0ZPV8_SOLVR|nr:hypothetical protein MTR67_038630 [Solanum verrucosum]
MTPRGGVQGTAPQGGGWGGRGPHGTTLLAGAGARGTTPLGGLGLGARCLGVRQGLEEHHLGARGRSLGAQRFGGNGARRLRWGGVWEVAGDVIPPLLLPPSHAFPQNLKKLVFTDFFFVMEGFEHCWFLYIDSIPQDFSNIMTLHELIDIRYCPESAWNSAKKIQQDMQEEYAKTIEVHILS